MNRTLCLFSSYFEQSTIPHYIQYYLLELRKHAQEVLFLSNEKQLCGASLEFLAQHQIRFLLLPNQGYDFGQWYRALQQINWGEFDCLILVNDSCILFRPLHQTIAWFEQSGLDYAGITDSQEDGYHVQSYFLMVGKRALPYVAEYFRRNGIVEGIGKKRRRVIEVYEIGLSRYLVQQQLRIGAMICYSDSGLIAPRYNMALHATDWLVRRGAPMIKKRFLTGEFRGEELLSFVYDQDFFLPSTLQKKISDYCLRNNLPLPDWKTLIGKNLLWAQVEERMKVSFYLSRTELSCIAWWIYQKDFLTGWWALIRRFFKEKNIVLLRHGLYWTVKRFFRL